jgi:hypothetical integral membrane protein (TIGR02206 family)
MESFRMFSGLHAIVLATIFGLAAAAIFAARRSADPWRVERTSRTARVERAVGLAYLGAWLTTYTFLLFPPLHEPAKTYPFQLCHLTALAAALLLITRWQWLRPLVYFWGFALCTQALITPALSEGPALYPFWFFWATHGIIIGVALYDVFARGYRPGWRDYAIACGGAAAYVLAVLPLNLAFGWNYGFVGPSRPDTRSIVDVLGPWPERLVIIVAIVAVAMALLVLPWQIARKFRRTHGTITS